MVYTIFYGTTLRNLRFHINKINALLIRSRQNCLFIAGKCGTWVREHIGCGSGDEPIHLVGLSRSTRLAPSKMALGGSTTAEFQILR